MELLNLSGLAFASKSTSSEDEFIHGHAFVECFFVCEGSIIHRIENREETLFVGDGVIIAPTVTHEFERTQPCTHRDAMISMDLFRECSSFLNSKIYEQLLRERSLRFHIDVERIQFFEKTVISYISSSDVFQKKMYEKILTTLLLSYIILPDFYESASVNDFRSKCITVISNVFHKPNAMELVYQQLQFNKSYLCKKFKDVFGITITDYINEMRVKYAAYLLSVTEHPLTYICESAGYESLPYFNKVFKTHYHTTPAKYRKTMKKEQNQLF